jgi:hypothetical protein
MVRYPSRAHDGMRVCGACYERARRAAKRHKERVCQACGGPFTTTRTDPLLLGSVPTTSAPAGDQLMTRIVRTTYHYKRPPESHHHEETPPCKGSPNVYVDHSAPLLQGNLGLTTSVLAKPVSGALGQSFTPGPSS